MKSTLALVVALLASLVGAAPASAGTPASEPRPAASDKVFTHVCEQQPRYECGTITVPLDYSRPSGPKLTIAVSRFKATGSARQGVILYNPGGPGGSGLFTAGAVPASVRAAYDFIGFDPRGVGKSSPISCVDPSFFATPGADPNPRSEADKVPFVKRAKSYADGCAARSGAELPYINSLNTARDVDEIRKALGESKITYYGVSYGTYLGTVYGQLFPDRVRRMMLDSTINADPAAVWYQDNLDQDLAFQKRSEIWFDWIGRYDGVFHLGVGRDAVYANYLKARSALAAKAAGPVGPLELDAVVVNSAYYDINWVSNARAFSNFVVKGDATALISYTRDNNPATADGENSNAVYTAVECNDARWPRSWSVWNRDNTAVAQRAPIETWANAWMNLPCAFWSLPQPSALRITGQGLPPILMLQGTLDAATPYQGALRTHQLLPSSRMIIEDGGGSHGVYNAPWVHNTCVDNYATAYLLTGAIPAADVTCAGHSLPDPGAPSTSRSLPRR
ncbi:alpha/beta hydrolase [Kutzneria kofuensis]|uniref:Pimeloyl-ACP methyl ester carboxylesterase n=1 Tax=Kutzneria kofuensis TaxID=103725 RepID=A0A7W9KJI3_9PSEU|nr:alpha/beta hydrolase [Kutzneria kofuensis]MBB5893699.1 pimeloyl-ACP methyl ester carboxylesterase [Kutzneria kofuensis]